MSTIMLRLRSILIRCSALEFHQGLRFRILFAGEVLALLIKRPSNPMYPRPAREQLPRILSEAGRPLPSDSLCTSICVNRWCDGALHFPTSRFCSSLDRCLGVSRITYINVQFRGKDSYPRTLLVKSSITTSVFTRPSPSSLLAVASHSVTLSTAIEQHIRTGALYGGRRIYLRNN